MTFVSSQQLSQRTELLHFRESAALPLSEALADKVLEVFLHTQCQNRKLPEDYVQLFQWYSQRLQPQLGILFLFSVFSESMRAQQKKTLYETLAMECAEQEISSVFTWFEAGQMVGLTGEEFVSLIEERKMFLKIELLASLAKNGISLEPESLGKLHDSCLRQLVQEKTVGILPLLSFLLAVVFAMVLLARIVF